MMQLLLHMMLVVGELPETGLMVISNSGVIAVRVKFIKLFPSVVFSCHQN